MSFPRIFRVKLKGKRGKKARSERQIIMLATGNRLHSFILHGESFFQIP